MAGCNRAQSTPPNVPRRTTAAWISSTTALAVSAFRSRHYPAPLASEAQAAALPIPTGAGADHHRSVVARLVASVCLLSVISPLSVCSFVCASRDESG